jgi:MFS family permease
MRYFGFRFMSPLLLGTLLNPVNSAMIATALVPIGRDLHVGLSSTTWLVSSLYLAAAVGQPTMGRIADLYGPRKVNATGFVLVLLAGVGGALAPNLGWLVVVRVLLGLGTSAAYPAAITMIRARADAAGIPTPGLVLGMISITSQVSAVIGPALGGLLVGLSGWRSIFLVNIPLAATGLGLSQLWLPKDAGWRETRRAAVGAARAGADGRGHDGRRHGGPLGIDMVGIALFGTAMTALLLFLMRLRPHPPYLLLAIAAVLAGVLVVWELRTSEPFLDIGMLIGHPGLARTYLRFAVHWVVVYCVLYGLSQWLESGRGLSPQVTGLVTLPMAVVAAVSAAVVSPRALVRGPMLFGTLAMIGGTLALLTLHATTPVVLIVLVVLVLGLPQGLGSVTNQAALYIQAPAERAGSASGLLRTSQYIGAIMQSSLIGFVFGARADDSGLHDLAVVLGALGVVLFLITVTDRAVRTVRADPRADRAHRRSPPPDGAPERGDPGGAAGPGQPAERGRDELSARPPRRGRPSRRARRGRRARRR